MALLRLPAPGLRGTFAKAYHLLTLLASKIGWDELLRTRSQVFVMEEEYRLHKTHASVDLGPGGKRDEDTSSVTGMKSPAPPSPADDGTGTEPPSAIPTIRISTESARTPNPVNGAGFPGRVSEEEEEAEAEAQAEEVAEEEAEVLEKPATVHEKEDTSGAAGVLSSEGEEGVSAFSNKRLCERWLGESLLASLGDTTDG